MLLPLSAVALLNEPFRAAWLCALSTLLVIALLDAVRLRQRAGMVSLQTPEHLVLYLLQPGEIELTLSQPATQSTVIEQLRLQLPDDISYTLPPRQISLPATIKIACLPHCRGTYRVEYALFELKSPWGGWSMRIRQPLQLELKVYPDLQRERRHLAALFLNHDLTGLHRNRLLGQGHEFEKLREYMPGDSYNIISWKATAKLGRPISKLFQIEDTQDIYVIFDCSRFSRIRRNATTNLDHYLAASFTLSQIAERQKDLFGLIAFDAQVRRFIRAGSGQAHHSACREAIFSLQPQDNYPDFNALFTFIRTKLRRRAMLIFLTDLSDPGLAEEFCRGINLIASRHLSVINMLNNREIVPLFSESVSNEDDIYRHLAGHLKWAELQQTALALSRHGVKLALSDRDGLSLKIVGEYLEAKRRQMI